MRLDGVAGHLLLLLAPSRVVVSGLRIFCGRDVGKQRLAMANDGRTLEHIRPPQEGLDRLERRHRRLALMEEPLTLQAEHQRARRVSTWSARATRSKRALEKATWPPAPSRT